MKCRLRQLIGVSVFVFAFCAEQQGGCDSPPSSEEGSTQLSATVESPTSPTGESSRQNTAVDAPTTQPQLAQTETVSIATDLAGVLHSCVFTKIGIARHDPRKEEVKFNAVLKLNLPSWTRPSGPSKGTIDTRTIYGKPFVVSYARDSGTSETSLTFTLRDVPSLDLSQPGFCCGATACDLSCGSACAVEFLHRLQGAPTGRNWGSLVCTPSPKEVSQDQETTVTVTIEPRQVAAENLHLTIVVPARASNATVRLASSPPGFSLKQGPRWNALYKSGIANGETFRVQIVVGPGTEPIEIGHFASVSGERDTPILPDIEWEGAKDAHLSRRNSLVIHSALALPRAQQASGDKP